MFVRWKQRPITRRHYSHLGPSLRAVVVKTERVNGRPIQRYVKHLGSIPAQAIHVQAWVIGFWESVDAALSRLELPFDERTRLEEQVAARVPRTDPGRGSEPDQQR